MSQPVPAHPPPAALPGQAHPISLADLQHAHAARSGDLQRIPAIRHSHGSGIINSGDCFRLGMIPTTTMAA